MRSRRNRCRRVELHHDSELMRLAGELTPLNPCINVEFYVDRCIIYMTCLHCKKDFVPARNSKGIYCSNQCQANHTQEKCITEWKLGKLQGWSGKVAIIKPFVRRYLFNKYQSKCCKCGWNERNPYSGNIPLEVNHIDGNAHNCDESNLELLCPNCHSLTSNYGNLNKNNSVRER